VEREHGLRLVGDERLRELGGYDAVILAVSHREYKDLAVQGLCKSRCVVFDVKGLLPRECADERL
jgi:UDP-N-acetyl-D-galactosamine dehydrogenase